MLYWLDIFGVVVFAISGALAADKRGMDLFGFVMIALLTAIGGGTLRDLILDAPVFWTQGPIDLWLIAFAAFVTFFTANAIQRVERWLVWADAIGISVFCVIGAAKSLALGANPTVAVAMGVVTAVMGGVVRDIVCNEVPLILRQDIYATAALGGALTYVLLNAAGVDDRVAASAGAGVCFVVRGAAIIWGWSLPRRGGYT
jgi:uncharacterized membrane protein YeiH